jgi:hypothetical protein
MGDTQVIGQPDISAYDSDGQLTLVAEVKNKLCTNRQWAARVRQNLLEHEWLPSARFFLLALPDRFYLWRDVPKNSGAVDPTYEFDPAPLLKPYYDPMRSGAHRPSSVAFELMILFVLSQFVYTGDEPGRNGCTVKALADSGLPDALRGGRVEPGSDE